MDTTIEQQAAMAKDFVPHAQRLRIRRRNFRLLSDIKSKESTLQLVYDVLRICPFFKAFLMDNKKHIVNLESFKDMLHICLRVHGQSFDEPPFEEEILAFIRFLRRSAAIKTLTDVNINMLYQPWRSFATIINKCLTRKRSGYDSLRLSQAQILWGLLVKERKEKDKIGSKPDKNEKPEFKKGWEAPDHLYHKRNVDYAYLMWEDFVYQVEHKNSKKSNEMYYLRFTKVIIHHFMSKGPSIPRRNKVNWHYVRDDHMFSTIKLVFRHQNTQQFDALLPIELTNEEIRNSNAYKEYYAMATGAAPPKPKASVRRTRSSSDTSITPPTTAASPRLTASAKGKQTAKASKAKSLSTISEVAMIEAQQLKLVTKRSMQQTHISQASGSGKDGDDDEEDEGDDGEGDGDDDDEDDDGEEGNDNDDDQEVERDDDKDDEEEGGDDEQEYDDEEYDEETKDGESFDHIPKTPENSKDEGNGDEDLGLNVGGEEGQVEEEEEDKLYRDININQGRGIQATLEVKDSHVTLTLVNPDGQQQISSVSSQFVTSMLNLTLDVANFSEFIQTNQFAGAVSAIPRIVQRYMDQRMNEAVKMAVQIQYDRLRDEAQRENEEFLKTVDENMQKIIKEQVKEQVSKSLPRIEQAVNEQLEAEVLTRSSHSSKTSYVVAADISEMELQKILIKKVEGNKSIQRSDEQRNLYKALVKAYESNKIILETYKETVTLKRRHVDYADKDEEPSAGPDRGSKRRIEGKEPESASAPTETATRSAGRSTQGSRSRQASASESALADEPMHTTSQMEEPSHPEFDTGAEDQPIIQSSQHPEWFSQQQKPTSPDRNWNKTVDTLTLELLAGPTYELMKGSCKSLVELEYHLEEVFKATTDQLDWVNPKGQQYPHNLLKPLSLIPNNRGRRVIPFEHFINNDLECLRGGASSRKYTASIMKTKAADYGHIKWIEYLVPRTMWIEEPIGYDKHALWGNKDKKNMLMRIYELHKFSDGTLTDVRTALDDRLKEIRMQSILTDLQPAIFLDDSEDEADEVEKEAEPLPKKLTHADSPPLKAYKPKIPYPQRLHIEKMKAQYAKFLDMIKEVRINVPLVDVLANMPNYGKFLKDLVSNKSKMEQIFVAFLTKECSAILQNKLPPKLGDPGSFLVPYKLANSVEYLALADLGASINLMLYSLYVVLSEITLKPTRMSIRLVNHTYQYPMGVAENMLIQDELDALLDDFKPFLSTSEKISETPLDKEFMTGDVQEDEVKDDFEELPPKNELRIKTSIQDPPTDLEMKPLPKHPLDRPTILLRIALLKGNLPNQRHTTRVVEDHIYFSKVYLVLGSPLETEQPLLQLPNALFEDFA
nr:reverse transcriptase domain-containing protein [Tanacetum cinerariifolium]